MASFLLATAGMLQLRHAIVKKKMLLEVGIPCCKFVLDMHAGYSLSLLLHIPLLATMPRYLICSPLFVFCCFSAGSSFCSGGSSSQIWY